MKIRLVIAMGRNREIGVGGKLPWSLPDDLKHFRALTRGKPVIMGRETFESIGHPLPERLNIVLTRKTEYASEGVVVAHSFSEAVQQATASGAEEICVIGGGQICALALPQATHLSLTFVATEFPAADAFFPKMDWSEWQEVSRTEHVMDERHAFAFTFVEFERSSSKLSVGS